MTLLQEGALCEIFTVSHTEPSWTKYSRVGIRFTDYKIVAVKTGRI